MVPAAQAFRGAHDRHLRLPRDAQGPVRAARPPPGRSPGPRSCCSPTITGPESPPSCDAWPPDLPLRWERDWQSIAGDRQPARRRGRRARVLVRRGRRTARRARRRSAGTVHRRPGADDSTPPGSPTSVTAVDRVDTGVTLAEGLRTAARRRRPAGADDADRPRPLHDQLVEPHRGRSTSTCGTRSKPQLREKHGQATPTYPGLYVEEIPSGVHPITGVSTSDTAFVDYFPQGPRRSRDLRSPASTASCASSGRLLDPRQPGRLRGACQFFINGGQVAWIVRVVRATPRPRPNGHPDGRLHPAATPSSCQPSSPGTWGRTGAGRGGPRPCRRRHRPFNLFVRERCPRWAGGYRGRGVRGLPQRHHDRWASLVRPSPRSTPPRPWFDSPSRQAGSVRCRSPPAATSTAAGRAINDVVTDAVTLGFLALQDGVDGSAVGGNRAHRRRWTALEHIEPAVVNLLCIPAATTLTGVNRRPRSWPTWPGVSRLLRHVPLLLPHGRSRKAWTPPRR